MSKIDPKFFVSMGLPEPVLEHRFHPTRKWRFDAAWTTKKVALEVDGGMWVGGRHNSAKGSFADMEKMNAAACLGWRVLRITPKAVGTMVSIQLVKEALNA